MLIADNYMIMITSHPSWGRGNKYSFSYGSYHHDNIPLWHTPYPTHLITLKHFWWQCYSWVYEDEPPHFQVYHSHLSILPPTQTCPLPFPSLGATTNLLHHLHHPDTYTGWQFYSWVYVDQHLHFPYSHAGWYISPSTRHILSHHTIPSLAWGNNFPVASFTS